MPHGIVLGLLVTALLLSGCGNGGGGGGAPNGGRGADNPTGVPSATPSDPAAGLGPAPEQPREAVPEQSEPVVASESEAPNNASVVLVSGTTFMIVAPWEEIQKHISDTYPGKVVVVDLWATYCQPCRESFPGLVALSQQDPDNIVCISVSLDDPENDEDRTKALNFLVEQQAAFANFLCTTDAEKLYDEILKIGGIPAVYVYGRDGQLAKLFNGPTPEGEDHTYETHITPFVTELAAQPATAAQ